jgi:hypothetical protein
MRRGTLMALVALPCVAVLLVASAQASRGVRPNVLLPPSAAHGAGFLIHSQLDQNYCIATDGSTANDRNLTVQQCSPSSDQTWAFTWRADNLNQVVEWQGMCLKTAPRGQPALVELCADSPSFRWTFTAAGLIQNQQNGACLTIPGAAANAVVTVENCKAANARDRWKLAH